MARRPEQVEEVQEGDRLPGEEAPVDDSHIEASARTVDDPEENREPLIEDDPPEIEENLVRTYIGGQAFDLTPEAASAYEQESNRRAPEPDPPPVADPTVPYDYTEEMLIDPNSALVRFGEALKSEMMGEMTAVYNQDQSVKSFWTSFYRNYPELEADDNLVKMVMTSNQHVLQGLRGDAAFDALAQLTQKEIIAIMGRNKSLRSKKNPSTELEGDAKASVRPTQKDDDADPGAKNLPVSITEGLKHRRAMRRKSRTQA